MDAYFDNLPPPEELPPNVLQQMSAMINALQNCRALLLTKNAEIKELEAKMHRLSSAQATSGTETLAAMAARKNVQEEVELLAQALQTAEASQAAVGQELQQEIARSRSLRCVHTYTHTYQREDGMGGLVRTQNVCIMHTYVCIYVVNIIVRGLTHEPNLLQDEIYDAITTART